jgi:hypothetical protein
MHRQSRSVIFIVILALSALVSFSIPARAQTTGPLQEAALSAVADDAADSTLQAGGAPPPQTPPPPPPSANYPRSEGFGVGAKIGPLFTSYSSAAASFDTNTGLEGGIWFGGNRGGTVGVMGEVLYAQKKQSVSGLTGTTTLQYLEIPILMRINVGSRSRSGVSVYGLVGPVFDVNLKAKLNNIDVKGNYESLDYGILGGVGIEITRFLVEARYNWGLMNVLKSSNVGSATDIKSRSFAVLFGVRFN